MFPNVPEIKENKNKKKKGLKNLLKRKCNLVPRAFPLKNRWGHPFFKGKALGTRLEEMSLDCFQLGLEKA